MSLIGASANRSISQTAEIRTFRWNGNLIFLQNCDIIYVESGAERNFVKGCRTKKFY